VATGATPVLGRPGTVLPVTAADAESFAALGSVGALDDLLAVLVTLVVPVTVAVTRSVAVAPTARAPTVQMPVPDAYEPWLAVAESNVRPAGSLSVT
jgi:hypothetical protein